MPITVDVQGFGTVEFPDGMPPDKIDEALRQHFTKSPTPATDAAVVSPNFLNSELYNQGVQAAQSQSDLDRLQAVGERAALGQGRAAQPGEVPLQSAGETIQAEPDISSTVQQAIEPYTLQPEGGPSVPLRPPRFADTEHANLTEAYQHGGVLGAMMYPHKFSALMPEQAQAGTTAGRVLNAVGEIPFDIADFLATPEGVGTVMAGGVGPLARTALNLGFAKEAVQGFIQAGTLEDKVKSGLMAVATVAGVGHEVLPSKAGRVQASAVAQQQAGVRAAMREAPPERAPLPEQHIAAILQGLDQEHVKAMRDSGYTDEQIATALAPDQVKVVAQMGPEAKYQPAGGGEIPSATQEGIMQEGDITEHPGDGGVGPPATPSGGGGAGERAAVAPPSIQEVADWHNALVQEAQGLEGQARQVGMMPKVIADRLAEINQELAAGFPEPEVQPAKGGVSGQEEKVAPEAAQGGQQGGSVLAQMRPALKLEPGKAGAPDAIGEQGQTHAEITTAHPEIGAELSTEDTVSNKQRGFTIDGKTFLTREEAAAALGTTGELTSQKLRALQAKAEAGPTRAAPAPEKAPPTPAPEFSGVAGAEPAVQPGMVRIYHGSNAERAGRDFSAVKSYAQGYADKAVGGGGKVWYVDVPEGSLKTHDEYGLPMSRVIVPDEISSQAKPLPTEPAPAGVPPSEVKYAPPAPQAIKPGFTSVEPKGGKVGPVRAAARVAAQDYGPVWEKMQQDRAADPAKPRRVADELVKKPRAATPDERANLLQRRLELEDEHQKAIDDQNAKPGDQGAKDRLQAVTNEIINVDQALGRSESASGASLGAIGLLRQNDFSLSKMRAETQAVENAGRPLTAAQETRIRARAAELTQIDKDISEHQSKTMFDEVLKQERAKARAEGKAGKEARKPLLQDAYNRALKRIEGRRGKLFSGYDPTAILDETIVGAYHIGRGLTALADWSKAMIQHFGENIRPRLNELFARSKAYHLDAARALKEPSKLTKDEIREVADTRRAEKDIERYSKAVAANERLKKPPPKPAPVDPFLQQKLGERADIKAQYRGQEDIRKAQESVSQYEQAIASGQPLPERPRMARVLDPKLKELYGRREQLRAEYRLGQAKARFANLPAWKRAWSHASGVGQEIQTIKSAFDISGVARQGGILGLGHPILAAKAFKSAILQQTIESMRGKGTADTYKQMAEINNRPANVADNRDARSGVAVLDPLATESTAREEAFRGVLASKIPGIKWSETTFHLYLNRMRTSVLDSLVGQLEKMTGRKATDAELKVLGNYINIASGRGSWGKYNTALDGASKIMWSPRLFTSRIQFLTAQPFFHELIKEGKLPEARALIAKEYAQSTAGLATLLSLGIMAGAKIQTDPRSTEFGKMRFGKTRIDPFAGVQQPLVLTSQLLAGERKTQRGKIYPIRGDIPFGQPDAGELLMRFGFSKATPALGSAINVLRGRTVTGQPTSFVNEALSAALPLSPNDVMSAFQAQGVPAEIGGAIAAIGGMGVNAYQPVSSREQKTYRRLMESRDRDLLHGHVPSAYRKTIKMIKGPY